MRRLHALAREKGVNCLAVDPQDPPDSYGVEPSVVDQAADRLRMHAELRGHFSDADESRLSVYGRHNPSAALQVRRRPTWAVRTNSGDRRTYRRKSFTARSSSRTEIELSNFALIRPSRPTRKVHGSLGRRHSRTHRFSPLRGSF